MAPPRVWINYKPRIYTDIFKYLFTTMGLIEVVEIPPAGQDFREISVGKDIDVVLLSLDGLGQPDPEVPAERLKEAKVIAFSPKGDYGLRRMPGKTNWEELRPFGLRQLMDELLVEQA
jgi:hypothetical protein